MWNFLKRRFVCYEISFNDLNAIFRTNFYNFKHHQGFEKITSIKYDSPKCGMVACYSDNNSCAVWVAYIPHVDVSVITNLFTIYECNRFFMGSEMPDFNHITITSSSTSSSKYSHQSYAEGKVLLIILTVNI